jgi:hypothetical protein
LGGSWALGRQNLSFQDALKRPAEDVARIIVEAYRAAGNDIVWAAPGSGTLIIQALGGKLKFRQSGPPDVAVPAIRNLDTLENIDMEAYHSLCLF